MVGERYFLYLHGPGSNHRLHLHQFGLVYVHSLRIFFWVLWFFPLQKPECSFPHQYIVDNFSVDSRATVGAG